MLTSFVNALAENMADVLTIAAVAALIVIGVLIWRARKRRVNQLYEQVTGDVPLTNQIKETLAKVFNVDTAEAATIGAVTFVDIA